MAHQMSPPQRPGFGSPYYQQPAHSPPSIALPPAKRPRLSPDAASPQSPAHGFPGSPYSPYATTPGGTAGSPPPFHAPQPHAASPTVGAMGPPPKPTAEQKAAKEKEEKEKVTDISDISDAMWGSGVDLREEENYLSSTSRAIYGSQSSYDAQSAAAGQHNFSLLTQGLQPGQLHGNGPASQTPTSMESIQRDLDRKHQDAALTYAKQNEQHLRNPFLMGNSVRFKMHKIAVDQGVRLDVKGLYDPPRQPAPAPSPNPHNSHGVVARGPNGVALASVQASSVAGAQHAILEEGARYADILSLVSLAANERLRVLVDESYAIARSRRLGSHGVVPPDLKDIASGQGRRSTSLAPQSITNSAWDGTPETSGGDTQDTISFTASLTSHLSALAVSEHAYEAARIKRRAARAARIKAAADNATDPTSAPDPGTPGTPAGPATPVSATQAGPTDSPAPTAGDKPLTKKERERAAKAGQTEEVLHKNANVTAAMQLGFGKKAKRYSWMSGGAAASPSNPFARPSAPSRGPTGTVAGRTEGGSGPAAKETKGLGKERKFGDWREDGEKGRGLQMRDLAAVLERDARSPKTLERAWARLEKEGGAV